MISALLLNGVLKLIQVRKDTNKNKRVCRIYDPRATIPENILDEVIPDSDLFKDKVTGKRFKFTREGMIAL
jgi:hypothetical protein